MVVCLIKQCIWDNHDALLIEHILAERLHRTRTQPAWKSGRACTWSWPEKKLGVTGKEVVGNNEVVLNKLLIARQYRFLIPERHETQDFTRRTVTDGRVIFEG